MIDCKSRIAGVINFVTGNLRPVKSETDPDLSGWYRQNSLVFVTNDHACWSDASLVKKVNKRRFGGVRRSPEVGINRMMEVHGKDVFQYINERTTPQGSGDTTDEEK